ncbi:MAG: DUF1877 family protein [Archangium sp.]|nr:DUF1877 family protein [Archangium sp.]
MSVMTTVYRLTEPEAAQFMDAPRAVARELIYGEDGWSRPGLVFIKWLALDKHGGGVDLALSGGQSVRPLSFLSDEEFGDETLFEFPYGPGRVFYPETVVELAAALSAVSPLQVRARLTLERLVQIYPFTLRKPGPEDVQMLEERVAELRDFIDAAAKARECLMVAVD